jgi:RimJ/RimL family protein N-acetyltransferase
MRNPVMVGARVYLRPFEVSDAATLARWNVKETETFMERGREMISEIAWEHEITGLYSQQPTHREVPFAVCLIENDEYIGLVALESVDLVNRVGETGSWMSNPAYRGQGYGTEAKHLLLEYCFDRLHLRVLRSRVFEPNRRSAAALLKQGYKPAGRLAYWDLKDGKHYGRLTFDIMRDEWLVARDAWQRERDNRRSTGNGSTTTHDDRDEDTTQ